MKKRVLMFLVATFLVSVACLAQGIQLSENIPSFLTSATDMGQNGLPLRKGIKMKAARRADVVTPPADAEAKYYTLKGTNSRLGETESFVNVVRDGNDVYMSGLCFVLSNAYVKGTFTDDQTIVFAGNQYLGRRALSDGNGNMSDYDFFFGGYSQNRLALWI